MPLARSNRSAGKESVRSARNGRIAFEVGKSAPVVQSSAGAAPEGLSFRKGSTCPYPSKRETGRVSYGTPRRASSTRTFQPCLEGKQRASAACRLPSAKAPIWWARTAEFAGTLTPSVRQPTAYLFGSTTGLATSGGSRLGVAAAAARSHPRHRVIQPRWYRPGRRSAGGSAGRRRAAPAHPPARPSRKMYR